MPGQNHLSGVLDVGRHVYLFRDQLSDRPHIAPVAQQNGAHDDAVANDELRVCTRFFVRASIFLKPFTLRG